MQKSLIFIALIATLLTSCSSSKSAMSMQDARTDLKRDDYVLFDTPINVEMKNTGVWILFIKITGTSDERLKEKLYSKAVKSVPSADGIINPKFSYNKFHLPLIVFTYTKKTMGLTGKAYRLKTESELAKEKSDKKN